MDINVGDKVYDLSDKKIVTVTSVSDQPTLLSIEYSDGGSSSRAWAEENRCPVQVGDKLSFVGLDVATVTDVVMYSGEPGVRYRYPEFPTTHVTSMEEAEKHLVTSEHPYGEPFPTGSIVQFTRTRYRVEGFFDGGYQLVPESGGGDEGRFLLPPDLLELVRPPFPEVHSVWEDRNGSRHFVSGVDEDKNLVWISRFNGPETGISVEQMHDRFTRLL